jgi:Putative metal-binding motif
MRMQVVLGSAAGSLLLGLLVYCSPSTDAPTTPDDGGVGVCDDSGANCPCDPSKFKLPVDCYTGPKGTSGKGACKAGKRTCTGAGITTDCVDQVTPSTEVCDYLDNDCNGIVDDVPGTSALSPEAGGAPLVDTCQAPSCDPSFSDAGIGCYNGTERNVCKAGTKVCGAGRQLTCQPFVGIVPQAEQCNGWDDDCNDSVDDGLDNMGKCDVDPEAGVFMPDGGPVLGECVHSTQHCWDGGAACPAGDPVPEKCDGLDNDCNGKSDEKTCLVGGPYCCSYQSGQTRYGYCTSTDLSISNPQFYRCFKAN